MEGNLSIHSSVNDLLRLKKPLQFIREVVRSYEIGLGDYVGFSCAIAISKAEEMTTYVSRFCPIYPLFSELILALRQLYENHMGEEEAIRLIEKINSYFGLDRYELLPKQVPLINQ